MAEDTVNSSRDIIPNIMIIVRVRVEERAPLEGDTLNCRHTHTGLGGGVRWNTEKEGRMICLFPLCVSCSGRCTPD